MEGRAYDSTTKYLAKHGLTACLRMLATALVGYAAFAIGAFILSNISKYCEVGRFKTIDWASGLIVALTFASSELINFGRGKKAGAVRRISIVAVTMIASGLLVGSLGSARGWMDTYALQAKSRYFNVGLTLIVFAIGLFAIGIVWCRERGE